MVYRVQALTLRRPSPCLQVLLIVNEPNNTVYLSGRNVPTLAINTASAVQVRATPAPAVVSPPLAGQTVRMQPGVSTGWAVHWADR